MAEVKNIFDIAGRSMAAQMVRLNTVASNLANAGVVTGDEKSAYRAMKPVLKQNLPDALKRTGVSTVDVAEVKTVLREPERVLPSHPEADEQGFVFPTVDENEEMVEMLEPLGNIRIMLRSSNLRNLMMRTISMGK